MSAAIGQIRPGTRKPLWRRFRRADEGATAVEFGLVALPFFALLWSIIETAMAFWAQQVLETAVATASRQLYTNQFASSYATASASATAKGQTPPTQPAFFKTLICNNVTALINCSNLDVDVKAIHTGSFSDASSAFRVPVTNGNYDPSGYGYDAPNSNEICIVRASMEYPRFTSIAAGSASLRDGNRLLLATFTFRAEPFGG